MATNALRQVIGFHAIKDGILKMRKKKKSLIIDETRPTGQSTKSQLALIGRYFDPIDYKLLMS